jgi:hypothetical protein
MRSDSSVSGAPPRMSRGQSDATLFTPRTGRGRRGASALGPISPWWATSYALPFSQAGAPERGLPGSSRTRGGGLPGRRPAPTSKLSGESMTSKEQL